MERYNHVPEPRKTKTLKPFLIIILGRSGVGKTTLAKTLTNCDDFVFYGTDEFTVDPNIPIEQMNKLLLRLGSDNARANIPKFESLVYKNQDVFIDYCYGKINETKGNVVIEGVWFNNEEFLKRFKDKFKSKYKIWVVLPER
jgi:hypothetical protein